MDGWAENDLLNRSKTTKEIGMVHHERFIESRQRGEPAETVLGHAQAAEQHYLEALDLCPPTALTDLAPMYAQTATLYSQVGDLDNAREYYEQAVQYFERTNNRYDAGRVRRDIALMYARSAKRETAPARQRDLLQRARAYAQAALRDYQHYQGRATAEEAKAQDLLEDIDAALAQLP
jgi:tetratricopeptide (TPR) repeat protein